MDQISRDELIATYLSTVQGRGQLMDTCIKPGRAVIDYAETHPSALGEAQMWLDRILSYEAVLTGDEVYDKDKIKYLLRDMRHVLGGGVVWAKSVLTVDIREFYTGICEHTCEKRHFVTWDYKGTDISNTFIGYMCLGCSTFFRCPLNVVKAIQKPLRPYLTTLEYRVAVADRINVEPGALLLELRNSGGWAQPDPGVVFLTAIAASMGPKGNPMEERLNELLAGGEKPS